MLSSNKTLNSLVAFYKKSIIVWFPKLIALLLILEIINCSILQLLKKYCINFPLLVHYVYNEHRNTTRLYVKLNMVRK